MQYNLFILIIHQSLGPSMIPCTPTYLRLMDNHSDIIVSIMRGGHLLVNIRMKFKLPIVVVPSSQCCCKHGRPEIFLVTLHHGNQELRKNCVTQLMLYTGDKLSSSIFCCLSVCLSGNGNT